MFFDDLIFFQKTQWPDSYWRTNAEQFQLIAKKLAFVERNFSWDNAPSFTILFAIHSTGDCIDVILNWDF